MNSLVILSQVMQSLSLVNLMKAPPPPVQHAAAEEVKVGSVTASTPQTSKHCTGTCPVTAACAMNA